MNLYEVLGVKQTASAQEIKVAYRKLAATEHPDKKTGNDEVFARINQAYAVLSEVERRQRYDESGEADEVDEIESSILKKQARLLTEMLDNNQQGNLLFMMKETLMNANVINLKGVAEANKAIFRYEMAMKALKRKDDKPNLLAAIVQNSIDLKRQDIKKMEALISENEQNIKMLDIYEYDDGTPKRLDYSAYNTMSNGFNG